MKKMKKMLVAVVVTMAMMCMMLTGCGQKVPAADETMSALFELYAKENTAPMKDLLGFASDEDVINAYFEEGAIVDYAGEMAAEFTNLGLEVAEEDVQAFTDAIVAMINKATCTVEITSEEGDVTVVTLKINGFSTTDMYTAMEEAMNASMENISEEDAALIAEGDAEATAAFVKQLMQGFTDVVNAMEPVEEAVEVTVECEKQLVDVSGEEKAAWLPTDMNGFATDVDNAIFQE